MNVLEQVIEVEKLVWSLPVSHKDKEAITNLLYSAINKRGQDAIN